MSRRIEMVDLPIVTLDDVAAEAKTVLISSETKPSRPRFKSWVDDYQPPVDDFEIDREAFSWRKRQRTTTERAIASGPLATVKQKGGAAFVAQRAATAAAEHSARQADPVEQAKLHLQRRGHIVYCANVVGRKRGEWFVSGQPHDLTTKQLLALAETKGFRAVQG